MLIQTGQLADKGRFLRFPLHIPTTQEAVGKAPWLEEDRENTVSWLNSQDNILSQAKGLTWHCPSGTVLVNLRPVDTLIYYLTFSCTLSWIGLVQNILLSLLVRMWEEDAHVFGLSKVPKANYNNSQPGSATHSSCIPTMCQLFHVPWFLDSHLQELANGCIFPGSPSPDIVGISQGCFWQSYRDIRGLSSSVWTQMNFKTARSTLNRLISLWPTQFSCNIIWNYDRACITPTAYWNLLLPRPDHT